MSDALSASLRDEILCLLEPLTAAMSLSSGPRRLLSALGYTDAVAAMPVLTGVITDMFDAVGQFVALDVAGVADWEGVVSLLDAIGDVGDALSALSATGVTLVGTLGRDVAELLVASYLRRRVP